MALYKPYVSIYRKLKKNILQYHFGSCLYAIASYQIQGSPSMDDNEKLLEIQQELKQIRQKLGKLFPPDHPQFDNVFEDLGAAGYYIQESLYRLMAAMKTVQGNGETEVE